MESDQLGGRFLREAGLNFESEKNYVWLINSNYVGYAHFYLEKCWNKSKMINEADEFIYNQLIDIDTRLGTKTSLQLYFCLCWTTRWEIIKVRILSLHLNKLYIRVLTLNK